jgi:hypothetical protein
VHWRDNLCPYFQGDLQGEKVITFLTNHPMNCRFHGGIYRDTTAVSFEWELIDLA